MADAVTNVFAPDLISSREFIRGTHAYIIRRSFYRTWLWT